MRRQHCRAGIPACHPGWRANASVGGDDEDNHSNDDAKDPEEGVDAPVQRGGVWIGFGRQGGEDYKSKMFFNRE
jgi:hypothetical protein